MVRVWLHSVICHVTEWNFPGLNGGIAVFSIRKNKSKPISTVDPTIASPLSTHSLHHVINATLQVDSKSLQGSLSAVCDVFHKFERLKNYKLWNFGLTKCSCNLQLRNLQAFLSSLDDKRSAVYVLSVPLSVEFTVPIEFVYMQAMNDSAQ